MRASHEFAHLMDWCRSAPMETGTSVIEDDYWGFCAGNLATGITWFSWFPTRGHLMLYFRDCWGFDCYACPDELERDGSLVLRAARYGVIVGRFEAGDIDEDLFLSLLSDVHPNVTVHWMGAFADMLDGESAFARAWRADFRGMDLDGGDYPIEDDELNDVLQVMAWG